jgi:hypothetical protein
MMRETRSLNPPPLSLVVVHVIPWIQLGEGVDAGCCFITIATPLWQRGEWISMNVKVM